LAREAGYEAAFATDRAPVSHSNALFSLRRAVVFPRTNAFGVILKSQSWYSRLQDWKRGQGPEN
jgi:hypothetical protein